MRNEAPKRTKSLRFIAVTAPNERVELHGCCDGPRECGQEPVLPVSAPTTRAHSRRANDVRYVTERAAGVECSAMVGPRVFHLNCR